MVKSKAQTHQSNEKLLFIECLRRTYLSELDVKETTETRTNGCYLNIFLDIDTNGGLKGCPR